MRSRRPELEKDNPVAPDPKHRRKPKPIEYVDSPVHLAFGLTYASYSVVPRMVLEAMPHDWQQRFVDLMNELHDTIEYDPPDYNVVARRNRRFIKDPLRYYRHPDRSLLTFKKGRLA